MSQEQTGRSADALDGEFEILIVGAGLAGLYMLHRARQRGASVLLIEAGTDVGGTWYWNRYPGARVDVESLEYAYSFDPQLQQDWEWTERYAAQPELLSYARHVADRYGLREDIRFGTRVTSAVFDEDAQAWTVGTDRGNRFTARFCIMATGLLSAPNKADIEGAESFRGEQYLTSRWPHEKVDFTGKRVAVIGTGSSAIQCIPLIAKEAAHLTVFQRTPSYSVPLRNRPVIPEKQAVMKRGYDELRQKEWEALAGFCLVHDQPGAAPTRSALEVSAEERTQEYESRWASGGLCFYNAFADLLFNLESNETLSDFMREKIRGRVKKPGVAEKLIPRDYPILTKRLAADTNYYETFDRDNVSLVDIRATPIERIVPAGIAIGGAVQEFDCLVFATGFDAITGALNRIDIRGLGGRSLKARWADGPRTYLGMVSAGFPNLLYINGPGSPAALFNPVLHAEYQVRWIEGVLDHLRDHGCATIDVSQAQEDEWVRHGNEAAALTLFPGVASWYMGANIPGKPRTILIYLGGFAAYDQQCRDAAADGYRKFILSAFREVPAEA